MLGTLESLSVACWNVRSAVRFKGSVARVKEGKLRQALNKYDILMIQELHGNEDQVKRLKQR